MSQTLCLIVWSNLIITISAIHLSSYNHDLDIAVSVIYDFKLVISTHAWH